MAPWVRWLAAMAALLVLAAPARAQEQRATEVPVRAIVDGERATMVFGWPVPVDFDARLAGRALQVSFDRPVRPRLSEVRTKMRHVVESIGVGDDGRTLIMTLTGAFSLSSARRGNDVFVTLTSQDGGGRQAGGADLPTVRVRVGEHATYSRVVFDWTGEVGYRLEREGETAVLRFDRPARLDLAEVRADLPSDIASIAEVAEAGAVAVAIGVSPEARLRDFRVDTKVVVDVYSPSPDAGEPPELPVSEPPVQLVDIGEPAPAPGPEPSAEPPVEPEQPAEPEPVAEAPPPAAVDSPAEAETAMAEPETAAGRAPLSLERAPRRDTNPWQALDTLDPAPAGTAAAQSPGLARGPAPTPPMPLAKPDTPPAAAPDPGPARAQDQVTLLVGFDILPDGLALLFAWPSEVRAAVFARAGHLWVIFDAPAELNFRLLSDDLPVIAKAEQVPLAGAAAARFALSGRYRPRVLRDGDRWQVRLGPMGGPTTPLEVRVERDSDVGARLVVPGTAPGNPLALIDPEVGDQLTVVPVAGAGQGIAPGRRLVDLELLETAHGVVVRPISDNVAVRTMREEIEITDLAGLDIGIGPDFATMEGEAGPLTPPPVIAPPPAQAVAAEADAVAQMLAADDRPVFDFAAWRGPPGTAYLEGKHRLNDYLATLDPDRRGEGRLALARFHLADGQGAEALGWIALALADQPELAQSSELRALRGAANLLQGRLSEAREDLFDPYFDSSREMRLWRAAWLAEQGDMAAAHQAFLVSGAVPDSYPRRVSARFRLLAAEAAARAGDGERAHAMLDALEGEARDPATIEGVGYVRGLALANAGDIERALELLARAAESDTREVRARAERDRVELMLAEGLMTPEQAIEAMDALRFAWRGDAFELDLLERIAELQIDQGDFAAGLATYRLAIAVFPDAPDVRMIANVMSDTFQELFLGDLGEDLSPLEALAVYYEFRELTPVGAVGDQMLYRLADRLVEVDLLDQASAVLQHQVEQRLRGAELARVGARLASIYLLDKKPAQAARALKSSAVPEMPDDLAAPRRALMVHALTETGDYDEALALLRGDGSIEADRLRAEIYWHKQDWLSTATVSARLLARWTPGDALTPAQTDDLMRMAVALVLTNNRAALIRLKETYGEALARSGRAEAFRAIASYAEAAPVSPSAISDAVAEIDSYETFLASLREEVSQNGLAPAE